MFHNFWSWIILFGSFCHWWIHGQALTYNVTDVDGKCHFKVQFKWPVGDLGRCRVDGISSKKWFLKTELMPKMTWGRLRSKTKYYRYNCFFIWNSLYFAWPNNLFRKFIVSRIRITTDKLLRTGNDISDTFNSSIFTVLKTVIGKTVLNAELIFRLFSIHVN